jgi:glutathione S-transferase
MLQIYGHPFASYYWKVLIALYERAMPFEFLMVDLDHPENGEAVAPPHRPGSSRSWSVARAS